MRSRGIPCPGFIPRGELASDTLQVTGVSPRPDATDEQRHHPGRQPGNRPAGVIVGAVGNILSLLWV